MAVPILLRLVLVSSLRSLSRLRFPGRPHEQPSMHLQRVVVVPRLCGLTRVAREELLHAYRNGSHHTSAVQRQETVDWRHGRHLVCEGAGDVHHTTHSALLFRDSLCLLPPFCRKRGEPERWSRRRRIRRVLPGSPAPWYFPRLAGAMSWRVFPQGTVTNSRGLWPHGTISTRRRRLSKFRLSCRPRPLPHPSDYRTDAGLVAGSACRSRNTTREVHAPACVGVVQAATSLPCPTRSRRSEQTLNIARRRQPNTCTTWLFIAWPAKHIARDHKSQSVAALRGQAARMKLGATM